MRRLAACLIVWIAILVGSATVVPHLGAEYESGALSSFRATPVVSLTIDYPAEGSIFPPDISPPTFLWRDAEEKADLWLITVDFADIRQNNQDLANQLRARITVYEAK